MDSSSDASMQQKKSHDEVVKWNEYKALRDHLKRNIESASEEIYGDIYKVDMKIDGVVKIAGTTQAQVTTLQASITTLTQQIADF